MNGDKYAEMLITLAIFGEQTDKEASCEHDKQI
jgi:hypothetical protein